MIAGIPFHVIYYDMLIWLQDELFMRAFPFLLKKAFMNTFRALYQKPLCVFLFIVSKVSM